MCLEQGWVLEVCLPPRCTAVPMPAYVRPSRVSLARACGLPHMDRPPSRRVCKTVVHESPSLSDVTRSAVLRQVSINLKVH